MREPWVPSEAWDDAFFFRPFIGITRLHAMRICRCCDEILILASGRHDGENSRLHPLYCLDAGHGVCWMAMRVVYVKVPRERLCLVVIFMADGHDMRLLPMKCEGRAGFSAGGIRVTPNSHRFAFCDPFHDASSMTFLLRGHSLPKSAAPHTQPYPHGTCDSQSR